MRVLKERILQSGERIKNFQPRRPEVLKRLPGTITDAFEKARQRHSAVMQAHLMNCHVRKSSIELDSVKINLSNVRDTKQRMDSFAVIEEDPNAKYKVVGIGLHAASKWDPKKGRSMKRLDDIDGREIHALSFKTVLPVETIVIVDAKLGYERLFYPQGDRSRRVTRVLEGNEEIGHNIYWTLVGVEIGTEVSIYFAPLEGTFAWTIGPLDENYDMPYPEEHLRAEDIWTLTQFEVKNDPLSNTLLMAADPVAMWTISTFIMIPHFILFFLMFWLSETAPKQMRVTFYKESTKWEWLTIIALYLSIIMRKTFDANVTLAATSGVFRLARKVRNNASLRRRLYLSSLFSFLNHLQQPVALIVSVFVALYLSDDVFLNVLLNIATMEFVTEVDDAMISAWINLRYSSTAKVSFSLLDLTYSRTIEEALDIWHRSNSSKDRVMEKLCRGEISNEMRWELLTSRKKGLGIIDSMEDGRQCVSSLMLHLDVLDWENQSEEKIANLGGLYLAGTSNERWEHQIDKKMRATLFQYFPELTIGFPWFGAMSLDHHRLTAEHAPFIAEIVNVNPEVNTLSCNFSDIGDAGVEALCKSVIFDDDTLHTISMCACGLTDSSMTSISNVLRQEAVTLKHIWLLGNKCIGDTGAMQLAAALSDGEDANKTLDSLWMGLNSVSHVCQKECARKTNGRMVFLPDDQLADWERKGWDKSAMVAENCKSRKDALS